jgi:alpha-mannosidase
MEVEMKFFKMWWDNQSDAMKDKVRGLVKNGQLELVNAGWSMHDEACPIYDDMINNMMIGHDFVLKEFGVKPRIGWQIDPFGHSSTNARLFAEMGFDALFFARIDYQDKNRRMDSRELEWVWRPAVHSADP